MAYQLNVVLPSFTGPLELLIHLLEKNDIDIYDIPIHLVTEQFLQYIEQTADNQIDDMTEFIVMAANLLEIKSKMLLPIHGSDDDDELISEDDPRYDLVQRLLQYKRYKDAAGQLEQFHARHAGIRVQRINEVERFKTAFDPESDIANIDISLLVNALNDVINRMPVYDKNRQYYFDKLVRDHYTIEQKLIYLNSQFNRRARWSFSELIGVANDKMEIVVTFLALLEYLRANKVSIYQNESFSEIILEKE